MTDLRTELERVLALAEKATPGPWMRKAGTYAVHQPQYECWLPQTEDDADLIAAAVNLIRAHGRALAGVVADSERYRWLRSNAVRCGDKLDNTIDAAMSQHTARDGGGEG